MFPNGDRGWTSPVTVVQSRATAQKGHLRAACASPFLASVPISAKASLAPPHLCQSFPSLWTEATLWILSTPPLTPSVSVSGHQLQPQSEAFMLSGTGLEVTVQSLLLRDSLLSGTEAESHKEVVSVHW